MGRYDVQTAYNYKCKYFGYDSWEISWTADRYYTGSRLRYPRNFTRITNDDGARKFCKKHNIDFRGYGGE